MEKNEGVPNQLGKGTQSATMHWAFRPFERIDFFSIRQNRRVTDCKVLTCVQPA